MKKAKAKEYKPSEFRPYLTPYGYWLLVAALKMAPVMVGNELRGHTISYFIRSRLFEKLQHHLTPDVHYKADLCYTEAGRRYYQYTLLPPGEWLNATRYRHIEG